MSFRRPDFEHNNKEYFFVRCPISGVVTVAYHDDPGAADRDAKLIDAEYLAAQDAEGNGEGELDRYWLPRHKSAKLLSVDDGIPEGGIIWVIEVDSNDVRFIVIDTEDKLVLPIFEHKADAINRLLELYRLGGGGPP